MNTVHRTVTLGLLSLAIVAHAGQVHGATNGAVAVLYDPVFLEHDTGTGHPERAGRLTAVRTRVKEHGSDSSLSWPRAAPADDKAILACHNAEYLAVVRASVTNGLSNLPTGDTAISAKSWDAAVMAAGAGMTACDEVMSGRAGSAFCLVRPPGHHASAGRGMGFCILNNAAIAARHLQGRHRVERVLIADFDVHHGNGTQDIFYEDGTVFYFSVHQQGIYPGTGGARETGDGKGSGKIMNVPLPAGAGDAALLNAVREKLKPAMDAFKPEFVLVSAGFDGHRDDPLGGLAYTEKGYADTARELAGIADAHARGRIVFMLEGGYNTNALAASVAAVLDVLQNRKAPRGAK